MVEFLCVGKLSIIARTWARFAKGSFVKVCMPHLYTIVYCFQETEGVCVCVLRKYDDEEEDEGRRRREAGKEVPGTNMNRIKFPSFFTAESLHPAPYALHNQAEAANLLHSAFHFGLGSGILIAVPIPKVR